MKQIKYILVFSILFVLFTPLANSFGQITKNDNYVFWSSRKKLTIDDFSIKTRDQEKSASSVQFCLRYNVNGFDFLTKNFNKKVEHYILRSASSIDTTANISISIRYQQTLFDICEIYARHFRKSLKENRKKIASGTQFIDRLNENAMTDYANRRVSYDKETNFGTLNDKQLEWERIIQKELFDLSEFSSE